MEILIYMARCVIMLAVTWLGVRIVGKKSVAQMTAYDLVGLLLLTTVAAEPLVYKITSKASIGVLTLAFMTVGIGWLSLTKFLYSVDSKPSIVIVNGKVDREVLRNNKMNINFLLSLLRLQGYPNISDVEFAIIEPNGNLSIIPKSQQRPVKVSDLDLQSKYEGLALPLVMEGRILRNNLTFARLDEEWLKQEAQKAGAARIRDIYFAELDTSGKLYFDLYAEQTELGERKPPEF